MCWPQSLSHFTMNIEHTSIFHLYQFFLFYFQNEAAKKKGTKTKEGKNRSTYLIYSKNSKMKKKKKTVVPFFPFNQFLLCSRLLFIFNYYFYFFLKSKLKEFLTSLEYPNVIVMHVAFGAGLHVIFLFFKVFHLSEFVLQLFV